MSTLGDPSGTCSDDPGSASGSELEDELLRAADAASQAQRSQGESAYRELEFGDWSSYTRNKRAKLRDQQAALRADGTESDALQSCAIHITGYTDPPYAELRRLIVLHGGRVVEYLDRKRDVTHVVATTLPPRKRQDYKRMCVVRPGWVLESCRLGRPADTSRWRLDAGDLDTFFRAARADPPPAPSLQSLPPPATAQELSLSLIHI